jgi:hypothetical protein
VATSGTPAPTPADRPPGRKRGRVSDSAMTAIVNTALVGIPAAYVTTGSLVVTVIAAVMAVLLVVVLAACG